MPVHPLIMEMCNFENNILKYHPISRSQNRQCLDHKILCLDHKRLCLDHKRLCLDHNKCNLRPLNINPELQIYLHACNICNLFLQHWIRKVIIIATIKIFSKNMVQFGMVVGGELKNLSFAYPLCCPLKTTLPQMKRRTARTGLPVYCRQAPLARW